eukprot:15255918-Alexandrium_andersonii.AAC.1
MLWRAALSELVSRLHAWCLRWMPPGLAGGLPGASVHTVLDQLCDDWCAVRATRGRHLSGVHLDLSRAFDTV